jgi:arsenate reductase
VADRTRILVICTGNSARSQMAEGLFRHLGGDQVTVQSAGSDPALRVHPLAVRVMAEIGIGIASHQPKPISDFTGQSFDYVIAVCSQAAESCPVFPGPARRLNWFYDDPAAVEGSEGDRLAAFRAVRDDLASRIQSWLAEHT